MVAPAPSLVGSVLDGKFQIEQALASGAAGDVYEAIHLTLGSRVAVKVLRGGSPASAAVRRGRFLHEARIAAGIQSDHVVRVFDFAAHENGPTYLVMELLQGETLADRIRRAGRLSIAQAVDFVVQAATPLAVLHESGIIHRDVKPSNLFLARDSDGKERVKLLDFGIAAFGAPIAHEDAAKTPSRAMIGTPRYMAPEQVRASGPVDARADVWALGVTLYELLAGRPPFDAPSVLAVLRQIERKVPAPLRRQRPGVPAKLAAVIHSCLAKDRERRPANARALVESLQPFREGLDRAIEAGAGPAVDPIDLSLHDPDVEVLHPRRPPRWRQAATAAFVLCGLALSAMVARRASQAATEPPSPFFVGHHGPTADDLQPSPLDPVSVTTASLEQNSSTDKGAVTASVAGAQGATTPPDRLSARRAELAPRPHPSIRPLTGKATAPRSAFPKPTVPVRAPTADDEPLE